MTIDFRPTEVFSFATPDGRHVRAMIFPRGLDVILCWFVDDHPEGSEEFVNWDEAMRRAAELRVMFESDVRS